MDPPGEDINATKTLRHKVKRLVTNYLCALVSSCSVFCLPRPLASPPFVFAALGPTVGESSHHLFSATRLGHNNDLTIHKHPTEA